MCDMYQPSNMSHATPHFIRNTATRDICDILKPIFSSPAKVTKQKPNQYTGVDAPDINLRFNMSHMSQVHGVVIITIIEPCIQISKI